MWPDDRDLPVEVEAAFGADLTADPGTWPWTDLSARFRADPIRLRAGRSGGAATVSPGTCSVLLDNDDSALTPLHPMSPWWPDVELGTPLRVRIRRVEDAFGRTVASGWGSADSGQVWTASGSAADYSVSAGVARHSHSTVNVHRRTVLGVGLVDVEQVVDVATPVLLTGAALVTGVLARYADSSNYYWLRCEMNASGTSIQLKLTKRVAGVETQLASVNPLPGVTYAAGVPLRIRASVVGSRLAIKVWTASGAEPAGWQLTAEDSSLTAPGATGVQTWLVGGNTNALPLVVSAANYAARVDRFGGYADSWRPTYRPGSDGVTYSVMRVTASGILRRLQQGDQPALSAMRRTYAASGPVAYWPAEDGVAAGGAGSALPGHPPLTLTGVGEFVPVEDFDTGSRIVRYGTAALADLAGGGTLTATLPGPATAATATSWSVAVSAQVAIASASGDLVLAEITTPGGTHARWRLQVTKATSHTQLIAYDAAGAATTVVDLAGVTINFAAIDVSVWQVGGTIQAGIQWSAYLGSYAATGSVAGTLAGVSALTVNPTGVTSSVPLPVGHIAVWPGHPYPIVDVTADAAGVIVSGPHQSYRLESATDRLARLCAEDGVALDMPAVGTDALTRMGWQPVATQMDLYRECEQADLGILREAGFGLSYLPRDHRYNLAPTLTVDLAAYCVTAGGTALEPIYDDEGVRNRWLVERSDGSSAVAEDSDHQRRGVYADSTVLNLADDADLPDQAAWRVHLGTVVDLREDAVPLDLLANPDLVDGWLSCGVGSRIVRTNPPATHRPGDIDRLVDGWSETLGPRHWQVQIAASPATPWDVATADGDDRAVADGSTLAADLTASGLSLSLATTATGGLWTTKAAAFPLDLRVGGEQVTVSAITGATSPQTATVSARGVNGISRAWPAGTEVDVWAPAVAAL